LSHFFPAQLSLLDFFDVRLLNVALKVTTKVENVDVKVAFVALNQLLVGKVLAVVQIEQWLGIVRFAYLAVRFKPQMLSPPFWFVLWSTWHAFS